jgi:hypothetical protein
VARHILPKYVTDKLLDKEILYQIMEVGITYFLLSSNKNLWPRFPINVGRFTLTNGPHARKEAKVLEDLYLCTREPKGHDLKEIVKVHIKYAGLVHNVTHDMNFAEEVVKGAFYWKKY